MLWLWNFCIIRLLIHYTSFLNGCRKRRLRLRFHQRCAMEMCRARVSSCAVKICGCFYQSCAMKMCLRGCVAKLWNVSPGVRCNGSGVTRAPACRSPGGGTGRKSRNTSFSTHIPRTHPRTHSSYTSLAHIPRLFCMRKNIAPLSPFHQSCADRGEVNEAILLVLYKRIPRYASSHISGETQPYPRRGSRAISDIPPRHPHFTKIR
jgi:hypothetical protein